MNLLKNIQNFKNRMNSVAFYDRMFAKVEKDFY